MLKQVSKGVFSTFDPIHIDLIALIDKYSSKHGIIKERTNPKSPDKVKIVDNFLKNVKRKLKEVESFRDAGWTKYFFTGMANARNFVPFVPGSKYANQSPFEIAGGETYAIKPQNHREPDLMIE